MLDTAMVELPAVVSRKKKFPAPFKNITETPPKVSPSGENSMVAESEESVAAPPAVTTWLLN